MSQVELIPRFEAGERVIWHDRPYEWVCPNCGVNDSTYYKRIGDIEVIVVSPEAVNPFLTGNCCRQFIPAQPGFVTVVIPGLEDWSIAVPYTLLERIKKEAAK